MVVFTCNNCGESVKKPSVEKHYNTRCRNNPKNVSCMDCQKDFHDEEYVAHTKCISEAEKYSGKNYVAKENKNSGQKKQESWMDIVRSILESSEHQLSAQHRSIFQRLQNYDNVPRKKAKFQNFVANCLRIPSNQAHPIWQVLEKELENMKKVKEQAVAATKLAIEQSKKVKETDQPQDGLKRKQEDNAEEEKKNKKKGKKLKMVEENGEAGIVEETNMLQSSTVLAESKQDKKRQDGQKRKQGDNNAEEENVEKKKKKHKKLKTVEENGEADIIVEKNSTLILEKPQNGIKHKQEDNNGTEEKKKTVSDKKLEMMDKNNDEIVDEMDSFQWSTVLEKVVAKNPEGLSLDRLKTKLLKKYKIKLHLEDLNEKQHKKFEKKFSKTLKKCPAVQVHGEIAKPC